MVGFVKFNVRTGNNGSVAYEFKDYPELHSRNYAAKLTEINFSGFSREVLDRETERAAFLRYNHDRFQLFRLVKKDGNIRHHAGEKAIELIEGIKAEENFLVGHNLPLVISLTKRLIVPGYVLLNDLISDGNLALLRSVKLYDPLSVYKFSTYACNSILRAFSRVVACDGKRAGRFYCGGTDEEIQIDSRLTLSKRSLKNEMDLEPEDVPQIIKQASLSSPELLVINRRFFFEGDERQTLECVGRKMGISKERVRQVQKKALEKLRKVAVRNCE